MELDALERAPKVALATKAPEPKIEPSELTVAWLRTDAAISALAQEWARESDRFDHVIFDADIAHLEVTRRLRGRDVIFLVARRGARLVGYAAFTESDDAYPVQFGLITLFSPRLRRLQLIGGDMPIARDAPACDVLTAMMDRIANDGVDFIAAEQCADFSRVMPLSGLDARLKLCALERQPNIVRVLEVPNSHNAFLQSLKKKTRETLRRRVRSFAKAYDGDVRFERISTPEQVDGFIEAARTVFENSWKNGVLDDAPVVTEEDAEYLKALARRGVLRSYVLYGGGAPVCFSFTTQMHGRCDFHDVVYDKSAAKLAPGQVLIFKMIEDFYEHETPDCFDFGYGENQYKRVFSNESYEAGYYFVVRPWSKAAAVVWTQRMLRSGYHIARGLSVALNLDGRIRRVLKRGAA